MKGTEGPIFKEKKKETNSEPWCHQSQEKQCSKNNFKSFGKLNKMKIQNLRMCHNINHTHKRSCIRGEGWKEGSKTEK